MYNSICTKTTVNSVKKENAFLKTFSLKSINQRFFYLLMFLMFAPLVLVKAQNLTQANFTGVIVPQYTASGTSTRLPTMFRATVSGLTASTTYRYYCLAAAFATIGTASSGAGIVLTVNTAGTTYQTVSSGSLTTAGSYETFTTNASGSFTGWFGFINSGNAIFAGGAVIYPTITIGSNAGVLTARYALDLSITGLAYSASAGANNGSFVRDTVANATAKNIIALYDTTVSTARRPLAVTCVENIGVTIASAITGYKTNAGGWNAIIPNGTSGFQLKRIEQYSASTGSSICAAVKYSGNFTSTATGNGTTPKDISATSSSVTPSVSAAITTGTQTSCNGTTVGFTATPTNGGTAPVYQWKLNSANAGTNATTYSSAAFANNDAVFVVMSPDSVCASSQAPQSTTTTLTVNANVSASVSAVVDDNTPVVGQSITFTATPTNGGSPSYQWYKNTVAIGSATSSTYTTNSNYADGDIFYVTMTSTATCASPTTSQSSNISITLDASGCSGTPPTATTVASFTTVCNNGSSNLSLTGLGSATGYTFQWQDSTAGGSWANVSGETALTYSVTSIVASKYYRCVVTCSNSSSTAGSNPVLVSVASNVTPLVTIATGTNPSCNGSSVTYTATPVNGGASPSYAWYLNGTVVSGVTGAIYTTSGLANGNTIFAILTSSFACVTKASDTSSTVTHNVTATVAASVLIASSVNPSCAGASVTFTATPTNGGTPTYQWYNGLTLLIGETNSTYTSSSITTGSSITVVMTSTATCATGSPATSNAVLQTVSANVTPAMTIASNNNPVCTSGSPNATFSISPVSPGTTPVYAWYLNGSLVSGQTGTTYTRSPVVSGDSVYATMTSSLACVTTSNATSNGIKETIVSPSAPTVSIAASPGTSIFDGTNVTFSATPTFGGTTPHYQWKLNGNNVGTDTTTYSSTTLVQGDAVTCVLTSNYTCLTTSTATSNSLTITILGNSPFTPGNLIVYRAGDSVNTLVTNAMPIFLAEYTTSGNLVQAKRISKNSTGVNSIYCSGSSTSEGQMTLNTNGLNLVVPGYYTSLNTASITTSASATINRVAALIDVNQNVDTTTRLSDWATGGSPRGATASGTSIYVTGSTGGTRYAAKGATTSTQLSTTVTNMRNVGIFNGQLYATDNSGTTNRLSTIGTGLPTTTLQTMTNLPGTPVNNQPYGFFFADLNSGVAGLDVVYVCDDNASTITKYSLVSGTWTSNGTVTATSVKGLTAKISGSIVTLYGTAVTTGTVGTYIYSYTDASGYNGTISGTATKLVDRTSVTLMAFRGIAFAPTSIVTQPSNASVCTGFNTSMSVVMTTGTSSSIYTYQWQISSDNGSTWNNLSNSGAYTNVATATLGISNPSISLDNTQYRCQVTYMGTTVLTTNAAILTVTTTVTPSVSIATATDTVCSGNAVTFTATGVNAGSSPVYTWKKNGSGVGSGSSITFPGGTLTNGDSITCVLTANNACQTAATVNSNFHKLTVKTSPAIGTTTGFTACNLGSTIGIYNTNTQGGGVWSSSNTAVATVTTASNGGTGLVVPTGNGTAVVTFSKSSSNGCVSAASANVIVAVATTPNGITGINNVCKGNTTQLSTTTTGGVWNTVTTSYATVNSTGLVTSTNAGNAIIKYTVTNANGCSASTSYTVTVNGFPATPSIGYAPGTPNPQVGTAGGFCIGRIFTVVGSPAGGTWLSTNTAVMTVTSPAGLVEIVGAGTTGLKYTYTDANGCSNSRTTAGVGVACASRGVNGISNEKLVASSEFVMYPNPAKSFVNLQVTTLVGTGSIIVTDLYGKQVKTQPLSMGNNTMAIAGLTKGIYFVSTITNGGKTTKKLIIE